MNDRFNFRVAIKQAEGTYKRYNVISLGRDARGLYARCSIPHKENEFYLHDIVIDGENAILEQTTGLKDKNGKLIFDGDVLRFASMIDVCVSFRNGGFVYSVWEDEKLCYRLTEVIAGSTEIIGNIHDKEGE